MDELITTGELLARTGLSRSQLRWRRKLHADRIVPSKRIGRNWMWKSTLTEILIGLPLSRPTSN